jgi:hypothetical protein
MNRATPEQEAETVAAFVSDTEKILYKLNRTSRHRVLTHSGNDKDNKHCQIVAG